MTISQQFTVFCTALEACYPAPEAESIARLVFEDYFHCSRIALRSKMAETLDPQAEKDLQQVLERLLDAEPVQYVLGNAFFYGHSFAVAPGVLIPRRETEELVDWVLKSHQGQPPATIFDIGTGSGCIAICLQKEWPQSEVSAIDKSAAALAIAAINTRNIVPGSRLHLLQRDITDQSWWASAGTIDVVVSNPPYITPEEKELMHDNVLRHEPAEALFVTDPDPLYFYSLIADFAARQLKKGGELYFEINEAFGPHTLDMLARKGFVETVLKKDMQGKDRMVKGTWA